MSNPRLNDTILALYRGCRDIPARDFKEWAMETARNAVVFDSGIWVTSDIVSDDFSSMYLFHQPLKMMENYARIVRLERDPLAQTAIASTGQTVVLSRIVPHDKWITHPIYTQHARIHGMEDAMCTSVISPITRITTFISFYRADPDAPFTETDRATKELLVPHLIEAMRINLFSFLQDANVRQGEALAICDPAGVLYETTPAFPVLLGEAWPNWRGPRLTLPDPTLDGAGASRWAADGLKFEASPCRDLFLVRVARENMLDRLSPRQLAVAEMLAKGKRYKDIARELDISPSTVTNHVNQIHARLEIDKREDLVRLVLGK